MAKRNRNWLSKRRILFGILVAVACTFAALRHPWVRGELHDLVAKAIHDELGLNADLGPVGFELPFRIVASDIRLDHPEHGALARARRLVIEPSLTDLLLAELELKRIQIEGARVRLAVREGKVVNLPHFELSEDADASSRIPLEQLILRQAQFDLDMYPHGSASLEQVSLLLQVEDGVRVQVKVESRGGHVRHVLGEERIDVLKAHARFSPDRIGIEELSLVSAPLQLRVVDVDAELPLEHGRYKGQIITRADIGRLTQLPHGYELPDMHGHLGFNGDVEGTGKQWHAAGKVTGDQFTIEGNGTGLLDLKVDATDEEVRVLKGSVMHVIEGGGVAKLSARLGLGPGLPLEAEGDIPDLQLHKLMKQLGISPDSVAYWDMAGKFKLKGKCDPLDLNGPIEARNHEYRTMDGPWHDPSAQVVIGTQPAGLLKGRVSVRPDALRFEGLKGHIDKSALEVDLMFGFGDWMEVHARSDDFDLADAPHLLGMEIEGKGRFKLDVVGTYSFPYPVLTGSMQLKDFALAGYRVGKIKGTAKMEQAGLAVRFSDMEVEKNDSRYVIDDMLLDFTKHFAVDATGRVQRMSLADFYHTFGLEEDEDFTPYQGEFSGATKVRYTLGFPEDTPSGTLAVDIFADVKEASAHDVTFGRGKLDARWQWREIDKGTAGARLTLEQLHLRKGAGSLHARGTMDYGGALKMTATAQNLPLGQTEPFAEAMPGVSGVYSALAKIGGTLSTPLVHTDVNIAGVALNDQALGDARLYVRLTHKDDPWVVATAGWDLDAPPKGEKCARARMGLATADWQADPDEPAPPLAYLVCGRGLDGHVDLDVAVGVADGVPLRGLVGVNDLPTATFFERRHRRQTPIDGVVRGKLDMRDGLLDDVDSLVGSLVLDRVTIGQAGNSLSNDGPVRLKLTRRGFDVERAAFRARGSRLTLGGSGSLVRGLAINAKGDVDLGALAGLVSAVEQSAGRVALDMKVTGRVEAPNVYGEAALSGGELKLAAFDHSFQDVDGRVTFSANQVLLEELNADVAGGHVRVHGTASLDGSSLARYEVFARGKDLAIAPMDGVQVAVAGNTKLAWKDGQRIPTLTGTVRLQRASYTRPFRLSLTDQLTGFTAQREEAERYDPELDRVAIDVRVIDDTPLRVSNNLLDAELRIEDSEDPFRVVGTDQRLGVLGTLAIQRGVLRFRNTDFDVESGRVVFEDRHRVHPRFDVRARTQIRRTGELSGPRWLIGLHAVGDADTLALDMSSEPSLAKEDIALLLTVGMTRAEADRLQGGLGSSAALEALASVSGVDREVRRALPVIDDFSVSSAYSVRTNRTEPQITVGKQLSERSRAEATTGLGQDSNFRTGVEWRLNDQAGVEASYDNVETTTSSQFGNVGVDLRWRLEFD